MIIPEIKKILYTTDLSSNARYAFGYAASLANRYDAKITILHVLESLSPSSNARLASILGDERLREIADRNLKNVLDAVSERLDKFCKEVSDEMTECPFIVENIVVQEGEPVETILGQSEKSGCDVIVMGTHGHGLLADMMMGSTARRVVRRSPKPVLVIRLPEG